VVPNIKPIHHRADVKSSCLALTAMHKYRALCIANINELLATERGKQTSIIKRRGLDIPKNKSLVYQVQDALKNKLRIGEPKHFAKQQGAASDGIYSWSTYENYLAKSCAFVRWAKAEYGVRALANARDYVDAYLQKHVNEGYSPYTQKLIACALAKLYECSTMDFIPTQVRHRSGITRSRKCKDSGKSKAKFSESKNQEFVDFCRATGLRRHEIKQLKPENLGYDQATGKYMLVGIKGKGGRLREAPILSDKVVERMKNTPSWSAYLEQNPITGGYSFVPS